MPRFVTLFALIALLAATAHGEERSDVVDHIIDRLGPVNAQEDTNLCFGSAGADVAEWHTGHRVSQFSVAVRDFQRRTGIDNLLFSPVANLTSAVHGVSPYMGGLASSTLSNMLGTTLCLDDQPEDNLYYRDADLKDFSDTFEQYRSYIGTTAPTQLFVKMQSDLAMILPSLDAGDFIRHLSPMQTRDQALGAWLDRQCNVRITDAHVHVEGSDNRMDRDELIKRLNAALAAGEIAAIHWDYRLILPDPPIVVNLPVPGPLNGLFAAAANVLNNTAESTVGFHVSTIVARRVEDGKNLYLLRNSWGRDCSWYPAESQARCDRGHFWLTEQDVRSVVTSTAYYWPDGKKAW